MMLVGVFSILSSLFKCALQIKEEMFRKMFHVLPKKPHLVKIVCNKPPDLSLLQNPVTREMLIF